MDTAVVRPVVEMRRVTNEPFSLWSELEVVNEWKDLRGDRTYEITRSTNGGCQYSE